MTVLTREQVCLDALVRIASYQPDPDGVAKAAICAASSLAAHTEYGFVKPDTSDAVFFYEQDFYVLSNFSAFTVAIFSRVFPTAEHAYHYAKFLDVPGEDAAKVRAAIAQASSAHSAYTIARTYDDVVREDWGDCRDSVMREIVEAKAVQHEYVMRKLMTTGRRRLIEDSWRDDYWGWGPDRKGLNRLGEIWEGLRHDIAAGLVAGAEPRVVTPTDMELDDYVAELHARVDAFRGDWVRRRESDDSLPDTMSRDDWGDQFVAAVFPHLS